MGCVVAAACGYCCGVERVVGDAEDGVGVRVEVGDRVVLELDFFLWCGGWVGVFVLVVLLLHWVVWVIGDDFGGFGRVEESFIV